jgi:drug/metabolite transporter (DMT)-like permease
MVVGLGAALMAAVLFGVGAVMQAVAARRHGLLSPMMAFVVGLYVVGWLLHLVAIARTPLYVAQVGTAMSLAATALMASSVVGEPLGRRHWVAIGAQVGGLALLALAAGEVGHHDFDRPHTVGLYLGLLCVLTIGLVAVRWSAPRSGVLLGALAGLAYAGSPVASRALVEPSLDLATAAPVATIGLYGLLGFWLYSIALIRTAITAATAPVILLQTVLPAVIGILAFSDGVRQGWWPVALLGFVVSTAGALALCDAEARLENLDGMATGPMVGWVHDER